MIETRGTLRSASRDLSSGKYLVTFECDHLPDLSEVKGELDITAKPHRNRRSLNANALLWECLGRMAAILRADKWDVYLRMLKRYGEYTYVCVKPQAVEMLKRQWRECEEIGVISVNGTPAVQLLCYYGSSTYDSRQFTVLLDGVISEMKEMGLETPEDERIRKSIEQWEKCQMRVT